MQLVGDIGGTSARFAFITNDKSEIQGIQRYTCAQFSSPQALIEQACKDKDNFTPDNLDRIVLAVAGPVGDLTKFSFPNIPAFSTINFPEMERKLDVPILVINDLVAQALAMANAKKDQFKILTSERIENIAIPSSLWDTSQQSKPSMIPALPSQMFLLANVGTGLGTCTVAINSSGVTPIPGEGGHIPFSPDTTSPQEMHVLDQIIQHRPDLKREPGTDAQPAISYELIASGQGIVNSYKALTGEWEENVRATEIAKLARKGNHNAEKAISMFVEFFGRAAGIAVQNNLTRGGIIIPNGTIMQSLGDLFKIEVFLKGLHRSDFENTAEKREINPARDVPVLLMHGEETGLQGAAVLALNEPA